MNSDHMYYETRRDKVPGATLCALRHNKRLLKDEIKSTRKTNVSTAEACALRSQKHELKVQLDMLRREAKREERETVGCIIS